MNAAQVWPTLIVLTATAIAAAGDWKSFKIYNVLTFPLIASGLIYHTAMSHTTGLVGSLAGLCVGGGALLLFYLVGGMGAGDVKLMAGVGAWLGLPSVLQVLVASSLAAGVYSIVVLVRQGGTKRVVNNFKVMYYQLRAIGNHLVTEEKVEDLVERGDSRRLIPFGAMIAVGIIAWLIREGIKQ